MKMPVLQIGATPAAIAMAARWLMRPSSALKTSAETQPTVEHAAENDRNQNKGHIERTGFDEIREKLKNDDQRGEKRDGCQSSCFFAGGFHGIPPDGCWDRENGMYGSGGLHWLFGLP